MKEVTHPLASAPLASLAFAEGGRKLYGLLRDTGFVLAWENANRKGAKPPKYIPLTGHAL